MYLDKAKTEEWYIVFCRATIQHWFLSLLEEDFTHVYAVKDLNNHQWLVIQPTIAYTRCEVKYKHDYPHIRHITGPDAKIIKVSASISPKPRGCLNWFNCVEQIKAILGVRDFWCFTPRQLYNNLLRGKYG